MSSYMDILARHWIVAICLTVLIGGTCLQAVADQPIASQPAMNNMRLGELIKRIATDVEGRNGFWRFQIAEQIVTVITDENADRMRVIVPIVEVDKIDQERLYRLLQANFDSALDARYSIAKKVLWSAFIHPLSTLSEYDFLSGIGQTVNLAQSYGESYSSGYLIFRGGDSGELQRRKLIDELIEKGLAI